MCAHRNYNCIPAWGKLRSRAHCGVPAPVEAGCPPHLGTRFMKPACGMTDAPHKWWRRLSSRCYYMDPTHHTQLEVDLSCIMAALFTATPSVSQG